MRRVKQYRENLAMKIVCAACAGTGRVEKPRWYMSLENGDGSTLSEWQDCRHCSGSPGRKLGLKPPT